MVRVAIENEQAIAARQGKATDGQRVETVKLLIFRGLTAKIGLGVGKRGVPALDTVFQLRMPVDLYIDTAGNDRANYRFSNFIQLDKPVLALLTTVASHSERCALFRIFLTIQCGKAVLAVFLEVSAGLHVPGAVRSGLVDQRDIVAQVLDSSRLTIGAGMDIDGSGLPGAEQAVEVAQNMGIQRQGAASENHAAYRKQFLILLLILRNVLGTAGIAPGAGAATVVAVTQKAPLVVAFNITLRP